MNRTSIEWAQNPDGSPGYTWNPLTGCLNHVNGMCKGGGFPCYAYRLAHGRLRARYLANRNIAPVGEQSMESALADPFYPRFWPERLQEARDFLFASQYRRYSAPVGVFMCDMSDLFGKGIPIEWTEQVMELIREASCYSSHRFYLLTKQSQNLLRWSPFPENCYVGFTATNSKQLVNGLDHIYKVQAKVIYVSLEPLLEWHIEPDILEEDLRAQQVNWLIIGAQTKPVVYPELSWVREIVAAADKAGVKVFLKNNLLELVNYQSPETDFTFTKEGFYRQEGPEENKP